MRISPLKILLFAVPMASVLAQTTAFKMNVVYVCQAPYSFKFLSCAGTKPADQCDVQSFTNGRPFQRGKSTYQQVTNLLAKCHLQTPAEAQADARGAAGPAPDPGAANQNGPGPGGFKVGDTVRVLSDGWQEAKVTQVHGRSYVVHLSNGVDVSKLWPIEVRRENSPPKITPWGSTISTIACKCW